MPLALLPRLTPGSSVEPLGDGHWLLTIPSGPAGRYRWAQLDDYMQLSRGKFMWKPPLTLSLRARLSAPNLPGTWGFGFWNDPFNASLGIGGTARRTPALPDTAWFFYGSPANYLAFRDDHPAHGLLAASFASKAVPPLLLALGLPLSPLLAWPLTARLLRRWARAFIHEDALQLETDVTAWHGYQLELFPGLARFVLDGQTVFETAVAPRSRQGFVLWIDNQFAAFPPSGRLRFGMLENPQPAWLEVADIKIEDETARRSIENEHE
ncbi:MAG: hypothetical protein P4L50_17965 [Anaerolineaceae bacterium]|nr:hypothetical protein [Anaerolineaceae bacterium]